MTRDFAASLQPPVLTFNRDGSSRFVIVCDHASNRIPSRYGTLGLSANERLMHIAWDPGALAVSNGLAALLDAPLVQSTVSRLVIDPNRGPDAPDLIPDLSEYTKIPGNEGVDAAERGHRIAVFHEPFHNAIKELLDERDSRGIDTVLISIHSFTPVYKGVARPWPIGLIPGDDERFSRALLAALQADAPDMNVGWNEPYAAGQNVTHTLDTHINARGIDGTMIEIRNNEILEPKRVNIWAQRLARCLC